MDGWVASKTSLNSAPSERFVMKRKILAVLGSLAALLIVAWLAAAPAAKIKAGDTVQPIQLVNIHGGEVAIPSARSKWVHPQFRRFAGCPICNLHMQSFVERSREIASAGIQEVVVF